MNTFFVTFFGTLAFIVAFIFLFIATAVAWNEVHPVAGGVVGVFGVSALVASIVWLLHRG